MSRKRRALSAQLSVERACGTLSAEGEGLIVRLDEEELDCLRQDAARLVIDVDEERARRAGERVDRGE